MIEHPRDYGRGVRWGVFLASYLDDSREADTARLFVLVDTVSAIEDQPGITGDELRSVMSESWSSYQCHGFLSAGQLCSMCGAYSASDDDQDAS